MRDAMIAGAALNIFNNYSDRVRVGNLAQAINVLQADEKIKPAIFNGASLKNNMLTVKIPPFQLLYLN